MMLRQRPWQHKIMYVTDLKNVIENEKNAGDLCQSVGNNS